MKSTNKILLVVLLVLLSAFVLTKVFRSPALESSLDTEAFQLDTADVSRLVVVLPPAEGEGITLEERDTTWTVQQGEQKATVRESERENLFRSINNIKVERMVSRNQEKWNNYQVGDTTAIRVEVYNAQDAKIKEWFIGKESGGITYVRPSDESVVYAVEGNLRTRFGKEFDDWRDRTFLRLQTALINKITFDYPADSGFVLKKDGREWTIGSQKADSANVEQYLKDLEFKELSSFVNDYTPPGEAHATLTIAGGAQPLAVIRAWVHTDDEWVFTSTFQDGVYFRDPSLSAELFPGKESFLRK